jgi:dipeptidyl aminopeptidase/acylaminoacyl peptidase
MRKNITSWALSAFLIVLLISSVSLIAGEKKPMTFVDAINVKRVSNLRLSPDSSQLLFSQSEANWRAPGSQKIYFLAEDPLTKEEEKKKKAKDDAFIFENNYKPTHLWVFNMKTKEEKRLTDDDFTIRGFSVSRDGTKILFTAAPTPLYDDTLNSEIWIMDLKDGSKLQITKNGIYETDISLSPDNSQILFVADSDPDLKDYYYQPNFFTVPAKGGTPKAPLPDFIYEVNERV